jgi:hypothetical protein
MVGRGTLEVAGGRWEVVGGRVRAPADMPVRLLHIVGARRLHSTG